MVDKNFFWIRSIIIPDGAATVTAFPSIDTMKVFLKSVKKFAVETSV
jgi:hypothetical protein